MRSCLSLWLWDSSVPTYERFSNSISSEKKNVGRAACSTVLSRKRTFTPSSLGAPIAPPLAYCWSVINEVEGTENRARQQLMATENADMQVWLHNTTWAKLLRLHKFASEVSRQVLTRDPWMAFLLRQISICHRHFRAVYGHSDTNLTDSWRTQQQEDLKVSLALGRCKKGDRCSGD